LPPFFSLSSADSTCRKPNLLELFLVRPPLDENGGFINTYSEPNRGTHFSVYLPATENEDSQTETVAQNTPFQVGSGELILIVDDERNIREVTSATLEKYV